mmetsp:Transcript_31306/g.79176  ORF Transcript_31306/g.79176 Transcript_31306/m.79176 type:complete len:349 (-) Transcript_31306:155-1201(-)
MRSSAGDSCQPLPRLPGAGNGCCCCRCTGAGFLCWLPGWPPLRPRPLRRWPSADGANPAGSSPVAVVALLEQRASIGGFVLAPPRRRRTSHAAPFVCCCDHRRRGWPWSSAACATGGLGAVGVSGFDRRLGWWQPRRRQSRRRRRLWGLGGSDRPRAPWGHIIDPGSSDGQHRTRRIGTDGRECRGHQPGAIGTRNSRRVLPAADRRVAAGPPPSPYRPRPAPRPHRCPPRSHCWPRNSRCCRVGTASGRCRRRRWRRPQGGGSGRPRVVGGLGLVLGPQQEAQGAGEGPAPGATRLVRCRLRLGRHARCGCRACPRLQPFAPCAHRGRLAAGSAAAAGGGGGEPRRQ